jgi:hypothetical protein
MKMIEQVASAMQDVLGFTAYRLGRETHFVQRASKLDGSLFVQTLVFTYLANPNASLSDLTQTAAALGLDISPEGLTQRFSPPAADLLQRVLAAAIQRLLAADPLAIPLFERFAGVFLEDSTVIALPDALREIWPGCGNADDQGRAAVKVNLRLNLSTGQLTTLSLHAGRVHDSRAALSLESLARGALYLADLGYFSLERLCQIDKQDAFFLMRLKTQTAVFDETGNRWDDVAALLEKQGEQVDLPIKLGVKHRLAVRLLAVRVPQEVADQRRRKLRATAKEKGRAVSARLLALAGWEVFISNASEEELSLKEAMVLARARWQIELVFKLWKSHGRIDESRSGKAWRVLCDVYAKLLAMVVEHWVTLIRLWGYADRSLVKAAQTVQKYALQLASSLWDAERMKETLELIGRCFQAGCRTTPRKKHPTTFQLLVSVTESALA